MNTVSPLTPSPSPADAAPDSRIQAPPTADRGPTGGGPHVAVIGAGIVGVCAALELLKRGARVSLIDRNEPGSQCSLGNSGALSPGSVAPLAMPGILATVPKMLLDREGPLVLAPLHLPRALPWLMGFLASASPDHVIRNAQALADLHRGAITRHEALTREVGVPELFLQRGHLHLYPDAAALAKDAAAWQLREAHGYRARRLGREEILALEPRIPGRYQTAMFLEDHATIRNPGRYVRAIADAVLARGGDLQRRDIQRLLPIAEGAGWRLISDEPGETRFDHVVVAAGAWSKTLLGPLGVRVALESQRGYHVQFSEDAGMVSRTVVLTDRKVFVTPMEGGLRVGGTVEIAGLDAPPNPRRAAILEAIARESFPDLDPRPPGTWMGHRPCMPDSVPVVGPAPGHRGLWLALGHGHLGLTGSINSALRLADGITA